MVGDGSRQRTEAAPRTLLILILAVLAHNVTAAAQEDSTMVPRVSTKERKLEYMNRWVDAWKNDGFPSTNLDREWKFNEFDLSWNAAHSALLLARSDGEIIRANRFFSSMPVDWDTDPDMRVCEAAASYFQLNDLGHLSSQAAEGLKAIILQRDAPDRVEDSSWKMRSSENHTLMGHVWRLAAAMIRDDTAEQQRMVRAIDTYIRDRSVYGWYEHASPCYVEKEVGCLLFLRAHAPDEELRRTAELCLDILFADYALLSIEGVYGGPMARVYGEELEMEEVNHNSRRDRGASGTYAIGTVLFDLPEDRTYGVLGQPLLVFSDYDPPEILVRLATERENLGSFEFRGRIPGADVRHLRRMEPFPEDLDPFMHGRMYAWVTPNCVLGSSQEVPDRWRMHVAGAIRASLVLRGDPGKALYTEIDRERPPTIFQHKNVQIISGGGGRAWFPLALLEETSEENGWVFGRDENVYFGFRVVSGKSKWQGVRSADVPGDYLVYDPDSPVVLEVAEASDYEGDFERFRRDLADNAIEWDGTFLLYENGSGGWSGPSVEKGGIKFTPGEEAMIGTDRDHLESAGIENYPRFESPYLQSDYGSGIITIKYENDRLEYRFPKGGRASVTVR
jgi:hypothetical protein